MGRGGPVVFLGTSDFSVPSLEALVAAGERVALVVTQPDRPRGRRRRPEPPPVKQAALAMGLPVSQPESVNAPESLDQLRSVAPEFLAVVAYGQILKLPLLNLPARGSINLHPSLLPRHRGPSPVAWAILAGDSHTGVSTMLLDEGMDSGPVLLQERFPLSPLATRGEVEEQLCRAGARLLARTLDAVREGTAVPKPQDESITTKSGLITRSMRSLDWTGPAMDLCRRIHALSPIPGGLSRAGGRLLKILRVRPAAGGGEPGHVVGTGEVGPVVACGKGALELVEVQPEGKRAMSGADFARGGGMAQGDRLEAPWGASEDGFG